MRIREYSLPPGWFPRETEEARAAISGFLRGKSVFPASRAVICPHAGWRYSGRIAALGIASLDRDCQTVAILGGHLPAGSRPLFAMEDAIRTPFGAAAIDKELRSALLDDIGGDEDRFRDNTVEVLSPIARFFFPDAELLWLRLGADMESFEAGKAISRLAGKLGKKVNVIGSTDLTHYGVNYGFTPRGGGPAAIKWVREVNDAAFIKAVLSGNSGEALSRAREDSSACSPGAVLGAMGFAAAQGLGEAKLIERGSSADIDDGETPSSFVGYAAMAFGSR